MTEELFEQPNYADKNKNALNLYYICTQFYFLFKYDDITVGIIINKYIEFVELFKKIFTSAKFYQRKYNVRS